jgi:hypothetical protein
MIVILSYVLQNDTALMPETGAPILALHKTNRGILRLKQCEKPVATFPSPLACYLDCALSDFVADNIA